MLDRAVWALGLSLGLSAVACNLADEVVRTTPECEEGATRTGERCVNGTWVKDQVKDMSPDLAPGDQGTPEEDMRLIDMGPDLCKQCGQEQACVAQTCMSVTRIPNPLKVPRAFFGQAIDINEDWMAIGAPGQPGMTEQGRVLMYKRLPEGWSLVATLESSSNDRAGDGFGQSVAFFNDGLLVGAPTSLVGRSRTGQVFWFVLNNDTWELKSALTLETGLDGQLGQSIVADGTAALVGLPGMDGREEEVGLAYHLCPAGSCALSKLSSERDAGVRALLGAKAKMGMSLALSGKTAFAGAPFDNMSTGAVIGWADISSPAPAMLSAPSPESEQRFGTSLDLFKNSLLVGAPGFKNTGIVYRFSTEDLKKAPLKLIPSKTEANMAFGQSIDQEAGRVVVGAPGCASDAGCAVVFIPNGNLLVEEGRLTATVGGPHRFGEAVRFDQTSGGLVVGAPEESGGANAPLTGSIYVYTPAAQ